MASIRQKDTQQIAEVLGRLSRPVELRLFTQENECRFCLAAREMVEQLAELSENVSVRVYDFVDDGQAVKAMGVERIPAILLAVDGHDTGVRFYGVPYGYEFSALIEAMLDAGGDGPELPQPVAARLPQLDKAVELQVLVSPTCPYCPVAVRAAHKLAAASPHIRASMVEVTEFPFLVVKYGAQSVPHIVINEEHHLRGALSELEILDKILEVV